MCMRCSAHRSLRLRTVQLSCRLQRGKGLRLAVPTPANPVALQRGPCVACNSSQLHIDTDSKASQQASACLKLTLNRSSGKGRKSLTAQPMTPRPTTVSSICGARPQM